MERRQLDIPFTTGSSEMYVPTEKEILGYLYEWKDLAYFITKYKKTSEEQRRRNSKKEKKLLNNWKFNFD
jgi:hypothetical protein